MTQKLDVGNVLQRIFEVYRDQFTLLIPAALLIFLPVAIINGLVAGSVFGVIVAAALGAIATYWFQGMVVEAVRDIMDGRRDHSVGSLFSSVAPVVLPLVAAGILAGLAIGIGFILLIVPGLFLLTIWAVIAPAIVVERKPVFEAFGRSRELVRGHGWQVFGVLVVLFLLLLVVGGIIQAIFTAISDSFAARGLGDLLVRVLIGPLSALAAAVIYFDLLRLKGEALPAGQAPGGVPAGQPGGAGHPGAAAEPSAAPPRPGPETPPPPPGGQQPG